MKIIKRLSTSLQWRRIIFVIKQYLFVDHLLEFPFRCLPAMLKDSKFI